MTQARQGDTVKVHYRGTLEDGTVFDSSTGRDPLEFTLGAGQVIPGFEQAVVGMSQGESKTARIVSDQAYGPHREDLLLAIGRDQIPPDLNLEVGQQLQLRQQGGQAFNAVVAEISAGGVTLDANHPLAGEDLTFEIELLEIT